MILQMHTFSSACNNEGDTNVKLAAAADYLYSLWQVWRYTVYAIYELFVVRHDVHTCESYSRVGNFRDLSEAFNLYQ